MDSSENQEGQHHRIRRNPSFAVKPICLSSIFVLFLAFTFSVITKTSHFRIYLSRSTFFAGRNILGQFSEFSPSTPKVKDEEAPFCILWMAPFLSGGGYSSEAWSYILALNAYFKIQKSPIFKLAIEHHGDQENIEFWNGLPLEMRSLCVELYQNKCSFNRTVVICHSEPGAWHPPLFQTLPCPPNSHGYFKVVIGRTMFETDRLNPEHVNRCNKMDQVWVPSDFHVNTFKQSGVDPSKVVKIVQPIDLEFFDPVKVEPLDLPSVSRLVLGSDKPNLQKVFIFLSVFKWEYRKGWDVLLTSYLKEFSGDDGIALCLLTNAYHSEKNFFDWIIDYVEESNLEEPVRGWSPIYLIDSHIPHVDLPKLYKSADVFVLPSRGEGWGRPIVEAMAMSLPVIITNWSGPTEYLTDENSYPLPFDGMSEIRDGPFKGHLWAEPSVVELRLLMRHVMMNPHEAERKGRQARMDMMRRFSPENVAGSIVQKLQELVL